MIDKIKALFSGAVSKYLLYAIAALLMLAVTLTWLLRSEIRHTGALKSQRDQLQQSLEDQAETLRQTMAEQKRTDTMLAARERERNDARQATAALKRRINQLEAQADEAYQTCLDVRIPDAVFNELRAHPVRIDVQRQYPPVVLMQPTPVPVMPGDTFRDLMMWSIDLRAALNEANRDKSALQHWADQSGDTP